MQSEETGLALRALIAKGVSAMGLLVFRSHQRIPKSA
jgi:hypothetical protein